MRTGCAKFGILAQCHVGADKQAEKLADRVADHGLFSGSCIDITRYAFGSEPDSQPSVPHPRRATPRGHRTLIIHTARQETTQLLTKRHPVTTHTMPKTPASWPNTCPIVGFRLWEPPLQALAGNGMTALALRRQGLGGPGLLAFWGPPRRVPSRRTP